MHWFTLKGIECYVVNTRNLYGDSEIPFTKSEILADNICTNITLSKSKKTKELF